MIVWSSPEKLMIKQAMPAKRNGLVMLTHHSQLCGERVVVEGGRGLYWLAPRAKRVRKAQHAGHARTPLSGHCRERGAMVGICVGCC